MRGSAGGQNYWKWIRYKKQIWFVPKTNEKSLKLAEKSEKSKGGAKQLFLDPPLFTLAISQTGKLYNWKNFPIWLGKNVFLTLKRSCAEITISGRYIVGNESYSIPFHFPKDTEWNFKYETKIFNIFNFLSKNHWKMSNFLFKNENFLKCLFQT